MEGQWPQWLSFLLAALSGAIIGAGACFRWVRGIETRLTVLEGKVGPDSVAEALRIDRHDNVYAMVQTRVIAPLDKLEDEVKHQGQNIAILLDRDRIERGLADMVATTNRIAELSKRSP